MDRKIVCINNKETNYYVYEDGKIYNKKTKRFLNGSVFNNGYRFVSLSVDNKAKNYLLHRIVAQAFIPNPNNLPQVNHIDGNKLNNHKRNLEWVTSKQNTQHAYKNGLVSKKKNGWNKIIISEEELNNNWKIYKNTSYYISRYGEVYNKKTKALLHHVSRSDGYCSVSICVNGKPRHKLIHCLVAAAWLGYNEETDLVVNHIDGDKKNNSLDNLEIIDKKQNSMHSCYVLGNCAKKVVRYKDGEKDVVYPSLTVCARENNVKISTISLAIKNHSKSNNGQYYYKFLE